MKILTTIAKILGLSWLISLMIKYVAPRLTITVSDGLALGIVLLPSIGVALCLYLSGRRQSLNKSE